MLNFISIPLITGIVFWGFYRLFELFVHRKERLNLIDKLMDRADLSSLDLSAFGKQLQQSSLNTPAPRPSFLSLKLGCLLAGMGLGIFAGFFLDMLLAANSACLDYVSVYGTREMGYSSCILLFGGLGLLVSFLIEQKYLKKD